MDNQSIDSNQQGQNIQVSDPVNSSNQNNSVIVESNNSNEDSKSPLTFSLAEKFGSMFNGSDQKKDDNSGEKIDVKEDIEDKVAPKSLSDGLSKLNQDQGQKFKTKKSKDESFRELHAKRMEAEERYRQSQNALAQEKSKWDSEREKLSKEAEELRGYRFAVDYQSDPDFIEKYVNPIESVKNEMNQMLFDLVHKTGGNSEALKTIDFENTQLLQAIAKEITEKVGDIEGDLFKDKIKDIAKIQRARDSAINDAKKNYKTYIENGRNQSVIMKAEIESKISKTLESRFNEKDESGLSKYPYFSMKEIPADANDIQRKQIEDHNSQVEKLRSAIVDYSKMDDPSHRAEIAMAAVMASVFKTNLDRALSENKSLKDQVSKFSKINSTPSGNNSSRNGNIANGSYKSMAEAFSANFRP